MVELHIHRFLNGFFRGTGRLRQGIAATNGLCASDRDQAYPLGFSGFKTNGGSGGNIEAHSETFCAIKHQRGIGFKERIMRAHLNRAVPVIQYG